MLHIVDSGETPFKVSIEVDHRHVLDLTVYAYSIRDLIVRLEDEYGADVNIIRLEVL